MDSMLHLPLNTSLKSSEKEEVNWELMKKYENNMSVSTGAFYSLILAYSLFIVVGAIGNMFIIGAVITKKSMWTTRNFFILNLSLWDLTLCLFTMPMTLTVILTKYWAFGSDTEFLCTISNALPAINVYCSSFTIVVIALDRYWYIVHALREQIDLNKAVLIMVSIWLLGFSLSLPLGLHSELLKIFDDEEPFGKIVFCLEKLPLKWKITYSACSMLIQYVIPGSIVTVAYISISHRLSKRNEMFHRLSTSQSDNPRQIEANRRCRKTNRMLIAITLTYFLAWLPLNVFNVLMDIVGSTSFSQNEELYLMVYAACHLAGMSSACSNPILYGVLNDNFKSQFQHFNKILLRRSKPEAIPNLPLAENNV